MNRIEDSEVVRNGFEFEELYHTRRIILWTAFDLWKFYSNLNAH